MKVGDVYDFRYNAEETKKRFEPYHCFDGQLVVKERSDGTLYLEDTYWTSQNVCFTPDDAEKLGTLEFRCNLNDIDYIDEYDLKYYDDSDIFNLSYQHGCYKRYAKRKGAERSKKKMERVLSRRIEENAHKIVWLENDIKSDTEKLKQLQSGDTSIYI